jgi:hypothetical protein
MQYLPPGLALYLRTVGCIKVDALRAEGTALALLKNGSPQFDGNTARSEFFRQRSIRPKHHVLLLACTSSAGFEL